MCGRASIKIRAQFIVFLETSNKFSISVQALPLPSVRALVVGMV
jgi:hypothetical protein